MLMSPVPSADASTAGPVDLSAGFVLDTFCIYGLSVTVFARWLDYPSSDTYKHNSATITIT